MHSIPCDIVLIPDRPLYDEAILLSESLASRGTLFTLRTGERYPHVSLYMFQCAVTNLDKISQVLSGLAMNVERFELEPRKYGQKDGYVDIEYKKTDRLASLQGDVIGLVDSLRDGLRTKDQERLLTATGLERDNLERYGYRSVGELFAPHLTFARFSDKQEHTVELPSLAAFAGPVSALGLFEMGDNGTCVREIARFALA